MSEGWIETYRDANDEWRWRRIGENGSDITAESGEGYARRIDMLEIVAKDYPGLEIVEGDPRPDPKQLDDDYEASDAD
jgi:uncharacterized protein YegP (UPF0339 family)